MIAQHPQLAGAKRLVKVLSCYARCAEMQAPHGYVVYMLIIYCSSGKVDRVCLLAFLFPPNNRIDEPFICTQAPRP